jgi:two-component system chemotaxis response regulator CheB
MSNKQDYLVVIGASAGGLKAIGGILSRLRPDFPAAVAVVLHVPERSESSLFLAKLQKATSLPCRLGANDILLEPGHIYLAPAGYHMLINDGHILLGRGPAEGRWRPSINATLRSAATARDSHAIGIILTGMLDDGMLGMDAIRRCGGFTIVQDPDEADYPNMPTAVLDNMEVDECLPLEAIAAVLETYIQSNPARADVPPDISMENSILEQAATATDKLQTLGRPSLLSCPDCGGNLWEIDKGQVRHYRCHIGHSYTEQELLKGQGDEIEKTLWVALRIMEEKRNLLEKIARKEEEQGLSVLSEDHYRRAQELHLHVDRLKDLIFQENKIRHD